jgi:exonuclease VII small subunit
MEDIHATYEDAAAALADVALNLTAFLTENDEAALDQAFASLGEASALISELDVLLTDAGA